MLCLKRVKGEQKNEGGGGIRVQEGFAVYSQSQRHDTNSLWVALTVNLESAEQCSIAFAKRWIQSENEFQCHDQHSLAVLYGIEHFKLFHNILPFSVS